MSLEGFKLFADKFPENMLLLNSQGDILSANRAACRLLQRPLNELLHQNISLISNLTDDEVLERLKPCSRSRTPVQIALRPDVELSSSSSLQATAFLFTPATDSALAHILLRLQKIRSSSSQFAILKQDIANKNKTLQAMRVAIEAAEAANQAKSNFLANISHELRTPINAILGYSEMLMEEAEDTGQDDFIPDLKKINQAGAHLLSLINDVLDLSKIESGRMETLTERMSVDVLIDEVASTAQALMQSNNNHFKIERGEQLGDVYLDVTKLRQAMLNLLSNAAKFTHEGHVSLRVERSNIDDTDWLTFAVQDTGIGIAADKLEQVFEEFSQADNSTTRDYGGTGLGLTISRRFCKMMGGDLSVTSQPGIGSTFTVRLPAVLPGARVPVEVPPQTITEQDPAG